MHMILAPFLVIIQSISLGIYFSFVYAGTCDGLHDDMHGLLFMFFSAIILITLQVEVTTPDGNETCGSYDELHVHVSADTYEKIDAAVALIELLVTPVSVSLLNFKIVEY